MLDQQFLTQAKRLGVPERVALINELWASIDADVLPVSRSEAALVDRRLAQADAAPLVGRPWDEVEATLRRRTR